MRYFCVIVVIIIVMVMITIHNNIGDGVSVVKVIVKYSQVLGKFPLRQTGIKKQRKKHNPCVITISRESGFQDLEIKVAVGSPAGTRSLLVAATGPPTLSLLLLKCTGGDLGKQEGTHTERLHAEGGGVNKRPMGVQTNSYFCAGAGN